jgi:ribosome biogenesis SPOUT family RNA methylase Rps3
MIKKPLLVIEHCEPDVSKWLLLEYKHSVKIWGKNNTIFTNVKKNLKNRRKKCKRVIR